MTVTVYDNNTGEVLACANTETQEAFGREDVGVLMQKNTEPVFIHDTKNGKIILHPSAFLIRMENINE